MKNDESISDVKPYNFIVARLCDADFSNSIKRALEEGIDRYELQDKACPIIWKNFIIAFLVGEQLKKRAIRGENPKDDKHLIFLKDDYFQNLRVTFEQNFPTDDNGGSAVYDIHRKMAQTF